MTFEEYVSEQKFAIIKESLEKINKDRKGTPPIDKKSKVRRYIRVVQKDLPRHTFNDDTFEETLTELTKRIGNYLVDDLKGRHVWIYNV